MRDIVWTDRARRDYRNAIIWLAERNLRAARRLDEVIEQTVRGLAESPGGRPGRVTGTYEKVLQTFPYIIAYALDAGDGGERLVLLGVIHTSRDWPDDSWPQER